jgi:hypothetical protein
MTYLAKSYEDALRENEEQAKRITELEAENAAAKHDSAWAKAAARLFKARVVELEAENDQGKTDVAELVELLARLDGLNLTGKNPHTLATFLFQWEEALKKHGVTDV